MINDHNTTESGERKIQFNMHVNFIFSNDTGETRTFNILSDNEEIMRVNETDDIITNLFKSFLNNCQSEQQMMSRASDFKVQSVELLEYKLHKIKLKRGGSYIESPRWIRNKAATRNPKNEDDNNCFQYAATVALNHQNIKNYPETITNIKPFINKYNWEGINFSVQQNGQEESKKSKNIMLIDWKKFEQNDKTITLNILYVPHNKKEIRVAYKSKYNRKCKNQVVLLIITDGEKQH